MTYLIKDLLSLVDEGKLPIGSGYMLSFFEQEEQECLLSYYQENHELPNAAQLVELAEYRKKDRLDADTVKAILATKNTDKPEKRMITLKEERLGKYFPANVNSLFPKLSTKISVIG